MLVPAELLMMHHFVSWNLFSYNLADSAQVTITCCCSDIAFSWVYFKKLVLRLLITRDITYFYNHKTYQLKQFRKNVDTLYCALNTKIVTLSDMDSSLNNIISNLQII
ncbi:hypothetical protein A4A49_28574 [Nicotiana attenuata]|uniref:Uncharacterized protein n=1 Tax=Nicotiana attenuata TaxID=49451 RepID=A0A314KIL1_NICAT|nr:hypothetical protein A4A49_28574 [Nicotiana attenuata]